MALRTEADVVRTLRAGTYPLQRIYELVASLVDVARDRGMDEVHPGDLRWQRRTRGALQQLRHSGQGRAISRATWVVDGPAEQPQRLTLVVAGATVAEFELRLADEPRDVPNGAVK